MIRFLTAGESHGVGLTAIIDGFPSGVPLTKEYLNAQLNRRRKGYGRGDRMKIESDLGTFQSGVRHGFSLGSPITVYIENLDNGNWSKIMSSSPEEYTEERKVCKPRPGHSDLPGMLKYGHEDARNILERSSARETAARVAAGAVCKSLLKELGIEIFSYVVQIGEVQISREIEEALDNRLPFDEHLQLEIENSPLSCPDEKCEAEMKAFIDKAKSDGDSVGGIVKLIISGVPTGIGSHTQWDRRLDTALAGAIMSIQAVKGVEFGLGFRGAALLGSKVHDIIHLKEGNVGHKTNHAGGVEGGISNGENIVLQFAMKPIPTLYQPLETIDMNTGEPATADVERSDVCAVPAAAVVGEAMAALAIAGLLLEKTGGDSLEEVKDNLSNFRCAQFQRFTFL